LTQGNLGLYQQRVEEAREYIEEANRLIEENAAAGATGESASISR